MNTISIVDLFFFLKQYSLLDTICLPVPSVGSGWLSQRVYWPGWEGRSLNCCCNPVLIPFRKVWGAEHPSCPERSCLPHRYKHILQWISDVRWGMSSFSISGGMPSLIFLEADMTLEWFGWMSRWSATGIWSRKSKCLVLKWHISDLQLKWNALSSIWVDQTYEAGYVHWDLSPPLLDEV